MGLATVRRVDDEREAQLGSVVRRALLFLIAFAVVVALGTYVFVHALGLNGSGGDTRSALGRAEPVSPLPSTALPVPGDASSSSPGGGSSGGGAHRHRKPTGLHLAASPTEVAPMGRINLTGTWPGHDNVGLQVQRLEGGSWSDFPTTTTVQVGTFETYVRTGRSGLNEFRVVDPATHTASNSVRITVR